MIINVYVFGIERKALLNNILKECLDNMNCAQTCIQSFTGHAASRFNLKHFLLFEIGKMLPKKNRVIHKTHVLTYVSVRACKSFHLYVSRKYLTFLILYILDSIHLCKKLHLYDSVPVGLHRAVRNCNFQILFPLYLSDFVPVGLSDSVRN